MFPSFQMYKRAKEWKTRTRIVFTNEQSKEKMTQRDKKRICFPQTKLNTEDRQTNEQNFKG